MGTFKVPWGQFAVNEGHLELHIGATIEGLGTAEGAGSVVNTASFKWFGGMMDRIKFYNGTTQEPSPNATVEILGNALKEFESSNLINYESVTWTGGNIEMRSLFGDSYVTNYGVFDVQTLNGQILRGGGMSEKKFVNAFDPDTSKRGQFNVTGPFGGTTEIFVDFQNDGVVNTNGHLVNTHGTYSGSGDWW